MDNFVLQAQEVTLGNQDPQEVTLGNQDPLEGSPRLLYSRDNPEQE